MPFGRKHPFSGKAKKLQLKAKKNKPTAEDRQSRNFLLSRDEDNVESLAKVVKLNQQPNTSSGRKREGNRYALQFYKETKDELVARKELARQSLESVPRESLEIDGKNYFPSSMDIPKRPPWNFDMSRQILEGREHRYFTQYVSDLEKEFGASNLSYFELNLETWRQLWRVLEISDIVLIIVDARTPALMFPPSVYKFVVDDMKKEIILVLNKIDLVPAHLVVAWKEYFTERFPSLKIITFTSFPSYNLRDVATEGKTGMQIRRKRGRQKMAAEGALKLYESCNAIVNNQVDLTTWHEKILEEMKSDGYDDDDEEVQRKVVEVAPDTSYVQHEKYKEGILTIGCIGQPNVGKSSLMNAIMGKKVVSVSRTPGHTKHFQTIFLARNVRLCDCPGLVFPSTTPRPLQVLIGSYPIAQVREPFTAVKYLSERLDLVKLLNIQHPENDDTWSAMDICDGWAKKRGFYTAKAARLDSYRAANNILRMALDGKICLTLRPPEFHKNEGIWKKHPEVAEIAWIQSKKKETDLLEGGGDGADSEESENEGDDAEGGRSDDNDDDNDDDDDDDDDETTPAVATNKFALLGDDD